jgi:hypothetical protein
MANTVKLGNRPKNFKKTVKFPMLDGTEGQIECVFKYRTKTEYGEFVDELYAAAKLKKPKEGDFSMKALMEDACDYNGDFLLKVLDGWNLEEDLTLANLQQLCAEIPAAAGAIMDDYRTAVTEGRLGN